MMVMRSSLRCKNRKATQLDASTRNTIIAAEQLGYAEVMSTLHGNASAGQRLLDEIKAIQNGGR